MKVVFQFHFCLLDKMNNKTVLAKVKSVALQCLQEFELKTRYFKVLPVAVILLFLYLDLHRKQKIGSRNSSKTTHVSRNLRRLTKIGEKVR